MKIKRKDRKRLKALCSEKSSLFYFHLKCQFLFNQSLVKFISETVRVPKIFSSEIALKPLFFNFMSHKKPNATSANYNRQLHNRRRTHPR